jgi:phosphatidylserine/phosphatidylglycerophosphate/cardiolipin synthase-like enzyme
MKKSILILLFLFVPLLGSCTTSSSPTPLALVPTITPTSDEVPAGDWYSIYFSDPNSPTADTFRGGPDDALAQAIRAARFSVDVAVYHLNLWSIRDALIAAHDAGVTVRVVTESDNLDEVEIQDLENASIKVIGDRRESLMHNKFVVIDGMEVWTGSMNFTIDGAYRNNNNLLRVRSSQLAENYTTEFEEMFVRDMFGDMAVANTPYPSLEISGTQVETFFSPDDGVADRIVEVLQGAEESIYFLAFSFTSDDFADSLLDAAGRGVTVAGVFEESQYYSNTGTEFDRLVENGLDVRLDGNPRNKHHTVFIIDGEIVITGSYNFSHSAEEKNDENTLIIHNADLAAQFMAEFERVFAAAQGNR